FRSRYVRSWSNFDTRGQHSSTRARWGVLKRASTCERVLPRAKTPRRRCERQRSESSTKASEPPEATANSTKATHRAVRGAPRGLPGFAAEAFVAEAPVG